MINEDADPMPDDVSDKFTSYPARRTRHSLVRLEDVELFKESRFRRIALHPWTLCAGLIFSLFLTFANMVLWV